VFSAAYYADRKPSKCDGSRPSCHTCRVRRLSCQYSADADATPIEALRRQNYALRQARADDMATIDRLRSALNAKDLGISPNQDTRVTAQCSPLEVEGTIDPSHEIGGEPPDIDAFQHDPSLLYDQTSSGLATVLISPSIRDDGQDLKDHAMLILQALASTSDSDSIAILARLRVGHDWRTLADDVSNNQTFQGAAER
jgi:hypothetical protein